MALTQSLVESHSLIIDSSPFSSTGDKVYIDGHFYSDKPSTPSLLGAIVYWPLHQFGLKLDYGWNLAYYLIILLTVKLFWVLSVLAFKGALKYTPLEPTYHFIVTLIFAFASITFSWSATFSNHSLAASSLMIALMFYLQSKTDESGKTQLLSGLFFGVATAMDIPMGIFLVGFGLLVFKRWVFNKQILFFAGAATLALIPHFSINYAVGGTFLPLQIIPEFFEFEGSTWSNASALSGVQANPLGFTIQYAFLSLIGSKGFLWYNPLLLLLPISMIKAFRPGHALRNETLVIFTGSVIVMLYYFFFSSNYGGWSYSIRWFLPLLPLAYFYLFDFGSIIRQQPQKPIFFMLVVMAIVIALVGLINPWSNAELHTIPFWANLKQLIALFS